MARTINAERERIVFLTKQIDETRNAGGSRVVEVCAEIRKEIRERQLDLSTLIEARRERIACALVASPARVPEKLAKQFIRDVEKMLDDMAREDSQK